MELKIDFRQIFDDLYNGVYVVDRDRVIHYWNNGAERLTGYGAGEVIGRSCRDNLLVHVNQGGDNLCLGGCPLAAAMSDGRPREEAVYMSHKDGHRVPIMVRVTPLRDQAGEVVGAVEVFDENSPAEEAGERLRELEQMALIDPLTDLPNRRYLEAQLESRLNEFERYGWPFGVLYLDIDHFKRVNDAHGHETGDRTLRMIGKTLTLATRSHDLVGRWGGEEFLALVLNVNKEQLYKIGQRYRILVESSSLDHQGRELRFTISGGGAISRLGDTIQAVIDRADQNLYAAKNSGRNRMVVDQDTGLD